MMEGIIIILSAPWAGFLGKKMVLLYRERGLLRTNYRGRTITPALGPVLLLGYLPVLALAAWFNPGRAHQLMAVTLVFMGVFLLGLWDDLLTDPVSGFKGHLGALINGEVTGGLLKMIIAGAVGLIFAAALPGQLKDKILAILLLALSANGLNLLDRQPGRALKAFFLGSLLFPVLTGSGELLRLLLPLLVPALVVAPLDLGERAMLGDSGANLLGAALGVAALYHPSFSARLLTVLFWLAVHIYAEFFSISRLIERNLFLRYLDRLGCNNDD